MRSTGGKPWLAGLALCALARAAKADVPMPLDRFNLSLGEFYPTVDATVSAAGPRIAGTDINFERDLNLDTHRTLPSLHLEFLVLDSQGFEISGYQYSKNKRASLARSIDFEGTHYDINAFVQAGLRLYTYSATWRWWINPDVHDVFGFGLGGVYYDVKGTIEGGISVNTESASAHGAAEASATAPALTLDWRHAFSHDLRAYLDFVGVRKPSGSLTGHLLNATLGAEWYPFDNFGVALEYSSNDLDLKAQRDEWTGRASIHFRGPAAFLRVRF
jgi:hypothetical protein